MTFLLEINSYITGKPNSYTPKPDKAPRGTAAIGRRNLDKRRETLTLTNII